MTIEEKAKAYDKAIKRGLDYIRHIPATETVTCQDIFEDIFPEFKESEQNILFEELKALHLKMEYQTVCNDAGGNRMWRRAWQHVNEAINIIKDDKETFRW